MSKYFFNFLFVSAYLTAVALAGIGQTQAAAQDAQSVQSQQVAHTENTKDSKRFKAQGDAYVKCDNNQCRWFAGLTAEFTAANLGQAQIEAKSEIKLQGDRFGQTIEVRVSAVWQIEFRTTDDSTPAGTEGGCAFQGVTYAEGAQVCINHVICRCSNGAWDPTGSNCRETEVNPKVVEAVNTFNSAFGDVRGGGVIDASGRIGMERADDSETAVGDKPAWHYANVITRSTGGGPASEGQRALAYGTNSNRERAIVVTFEVYMHKGIQTERGSNKVVRIPAGGETFLGTAEWFSFHGGTQTWTYKPVGGSFASRD